MGIKIILAAFSVALAAPSAALAEAPSETTAVEAHETAFRAQRDDAKHLNTFLGPQEDRGAALARIAQQGPAVNTFWTETPFLITHKLSGMVCAKTYAAPGFKLATAYLFDEEGMDVGCHYLRAKDQARITVYATYFAPETVEGHFKHANDAIQHGFKTDTVAPIHVLRALEDHALINQSLQKVAYEATFPDVGRYKTALMITEVGGWHAKVRATYPYGDEDVEAYAQVALVTAYDGMYTHQMRSGQSQ